MSPPTQELQALGADTDRHGRCGVGRCGKFSSIIFISVCEKGGSKEYGDNGHLNSKSSLQ